MNLGGFDAIIWSDFPPRSSPEVRNRPFNLQNAIEFIAELPPSEATDCFAVYKKCTGSNNHSFETSYY
jgi:hypothetical protein